MAKETPTARRERILAYLKEHPDSTAQEIADAVLPDVDELDFAALATGPSKER